MRYIPVVLHDLYRRVRAVTERLAAPLTAEDQTVQTMPDVSPTKWHLAHTSWFFETFLLRPRLPGYRPLDERYAVLFNSYYVGAGDRHARPDRGHLSRPTVSEVLAYRRHVDQQMQPLLDDPAHAATIELGINHEEQHQELILTDIKHVLGTNPLRPAYDPSAPVPVPAPVPDASWRSHAGGLVDIGHPGDGFAFDNERPRHRAYVAPFSVATRLVTTAEWKSFILDGGYRRPELWLSDGWDARCAGNWTAPLYWGPGDSIYTLRGPRPLDPDEPVCHVSHYEADAFARWAGARLPLEEELELAGPPNRNPLESGALHPHPTGGVWQWTGSPYRPYPGFVPLPGALGEYNGKFMSNRMVLRGGSCFTPRRHLRSTYRNFFPPDARWQMSGLRLARDG
jgi:ergothioneine biosynthesis protein EgtB